MKDKLTFEEFWEEYERLGRKVKRINKVSENVMITLSVRIRRKLRRKNNAKNYSNKNQNI